MYRERKEDMAVYYWAESLFTDVNGITIADGFPETILTLPTIAVDNDNLYFQRFELGNRDTSTTRTWYIEVYAKNKTQRDEFAYRIAHSLKESIPVYDYDLGFPPTDLPKLGNLVTDNIQIKFVRIRPELRSEEHTSELQSR